MQQSAIDEPPSLNIYPPCRQLSHAPLLFGEKPLPLVGAALRACPPSGLPAVTQDAGAASSPAAAAAASSSSAGSSAKSKKSSSKGSKEVVLEVRTETGTAVVVYRHPRPLPLTPNKLNQVGARLALRPCTVIKRRIVPPPRANRTRQSAGFPLDACEISNFPAAFLLAPLVPQVPPFDVSQLKPSECSLQERYDLCRSVADECIQVCAPSTTARVAGSVWLRDVQ